MRIEELRASAARFADELSDVLNNTVCTGVRIVAVIDRADPPVAVVGYNIRRDNVTGAGIPVKRGRGAAPVYLGMTYRLGPDDTERRHLMVVSSYTSVCADEDLDDELVHFDYERNKPHGYPEAHVQVACQSPTWDLIAQRRGLVGKTFASLHLPVGGRRFRPTLEDIVEFLITEGIADAHPRWSEHVEAGRVRFLRRQLGASVRREPEFVRKALSDWDASQARRQPDAQDSQ